jgi:predicted DNA-binding protein
MPVAFLSFDYLIRPRQHIRQNREADWFEVLHVGVGHLQGGALQCNTKGSIFMERQLTMRLSADLATKLERSARRLKRKRSEVVREALEQYLDTQLEMRPIERVRDLLGSVASGRPDLGQRHREYLTRRLRRGR